MAMITDISGRRNIEQAARQHERLAVLATLSAGIAHELNNPIGIISTRLELMLDEAESHVLPREVVEDLNVLYRNIERVSRIAKGLLSLAKQSTDEPRTFNLNNVIEETLFLMGRMLSKEGIGVGPTLDRSLGLLMGDPNAFQQVLTNLLLNARDAMHGGGHIQIETAPDRARRLVTTHRHRFGCGHGI
jgi:signal transduction histidine kinase